jgi:D-beta-D-heptose 7-phosphate kinase/D-beta-D-heptose 1-phosphate adenosyltransferase
LNSDASVRRLKGSSRPINNFEDRKFALESCRYVDKVIGFNEDTPLALIKDLGPDIIVKGGDYSESMVVGNSIAEVKIFGLIENYSTTQTRSKIIELGGE